ncbi:hypothetical protein FEV51_12190 [Qipengyuania marisflavi]|uniref:Uncharacterized protein n=1 Tax=Qipengyuania marisflavi TaxID=2486356 RepID=A0A5S3PQI1_9SPHN|nr:hypothetical protein FEV51_12190 [Qipengyuania marisflavi]
MCLIGGSGFALDAELAPSKDRCGGKAEQRHHRRGGHIGAAGGADIARGRAAGRGGGAGGRRGAARRAGARCDIARCRSAGRYVARG